MIQWINGYNINCAYTSLIKPIPFLFSRLFIVHENGSGTELLHSQIVEELLFQAYSDPTIAIIKDPLPETQGALLCVQQVLKHTMVLDDKSQSNVLLFLYVFVTITDEFGITILKPCHESVWSQWLLAKQKPDITPPNLRNRSWHDLPREEVQVTKYTYNPRQHDTYSYICLEPHPRSSIWHRSRAESDTSPKVWWLCDTASTCEKLP